MRSISTREEARLRSLFQRLLLLSAATTPAACSTSSTVHDTVDTGAPPADATLSDVLAPDGGQTLDAGADATSDIDATIDATPPPSDANYGYADAACNPSYLDGDRCGFFELLPCGLPPDAATENCALTLVQCGVLCNESPHACAIAECLANDSGIVPDATPLTLDCATGAFGCGIGPGRRPEGLVDTAPARRRDAAGSLLAEMARLEAASVDAFRRLAGELSVRRAPRSLVRAAERSARDEVRHARVMARLARRRGAAPGRVVIAPRRGARSVEAFATENAVEGCVRECFAALVATRQASHARDPELAREMDRIARDETRHAALAWRIARWVTPRLDAGARARVGLAMRDAVASLRREVAATPPEVATELGLPTGAEARALVDGFAVALGV